VCLAGLRSPPRLDFLDDSELPLSETQSEILCQAGKSATVVCCVLRRVLRGVLWCKSCQWPGRRVGGGCHKSPGVPEYSDTHKTCEILSQKKSIRFMEPMWLGGCVHIYSIV
jgi:hypothetical protein